VAGTAAEEVAVVVATELLAEEIECEGVDARVDEGEAEADHLEDVPEHAVLGIVVVEPQLVDVSGDPAGGEHDHEREDEAGHLLTCLHLKIYYFKIFI